VCFSDNEWSTQNVQDRLSSAPSTVRDYSILKVADAIKDTFGGSTMQYMIDVRVAQAPVCAFVACPMPLACGGGLVVPHLVLLGLAVARAHLADPYFSMLVLRPPRACRLASRRHCTGDAQANERGSWGGVWEVASSYSFVSESNGQTAVTLVEQFSDWSYADDGVEERMPYLGPSHGLLTTSVEHSSNWWGSLVADNDGYDPGAFDTRLPTQRLVCLRARRACVCVARPLCADVRPALLCSAVHEQRGHGAAGHHLVLDARARAGAENQRS
jgi:hypothetical protein